MVGILLGGHGLSAGVSNLVVQLVSLAILAVNGPQVLNFWRTAPKPLVILVASSLALPLLQLIPLPSFLWRALPGRELLAETFDLMGHGGYFFSISVAPARTALSFVGLIAPFTVLVLCYSIDWTGGDRERRFVLLALLVVGIANVALGAYQISQLQRLGADYISGSFANKNAAGIYFGLMLLILLGWLTSFSPSTNRIVIAGGIAVTLLMAVVLTRSRSSTLLLLVVGAAAAVVLRNYLARGDGSRRLPVTKLVLAATLVVTPLLVLGYSNDRISSALGRFSSVDDIRPQIWQDATRTAERFFPVGSGMGTFDEVAQLDESLEIVAGGRAGRAHNEYLEILIEAGVLGAVLVAGWMAYVGYAALTSVGERNGMMGAVALAGLLCIALQSLVDYPMRTQAILCLAAFFVGLLRPVRDSERRKRRSSEGYGHAENGGDAAPA